MLRTTFFALACLAGCASSGDTTPPRDAGGGPVDAGADAVEPGPCGGGGEGCCAGDKCDVPFACVLGICGAPEDGSGGDACAFAVCKGLCVDTNSDAHNCGACGHGCQGNLCSEGQCLATGIAVGTAPASLAVDTKNVYFTDGDGTVNRAPVAGGALVRLAVGLANPFGVAVDATSVYFTTDGSIAGKFKDGTVGKVPIAADVGDAGADAGSAVVSLATGRIKPGALVVDASNVYWLEAGTGAADGALLTCPLAGCAGDKPKVLNDTLALPYGIAADDANLYVTTSAGGQVLQFAKSTGDATVLAQMLDEPLGVAVANGFVYFAVESDGVVESVPIGGTRTSFIVTTMGGPDGVAADGTNVYWSDSNPVGTFGPLGSCAIAGCPPATPLNLLRQGTGTATSITIGGSFVYFIGTGGQILRIAR